MEAYECGKKAEHHFSARFVSNPKELHHTLKKMSLHTFKTTVKPKKDKKVVVTSWRADALFVALSKGTSKRWDWLK